MNAVDRAAYPAFWVGCTVVARHPHLLKRFLCFHCAPRLNKSIASRARDWGQPRLKPTYCPVSFSPELLSSWAALLVSAHPVLLITVFLGWVLGACVNALTHIFPSHLLSRATEQSEQDYHSRCVLHAHARAKQNQTRQAPKRQMCVQMHTPPAAHRQSRSSSGKQLESKCKRANAADARRSRGGLAATTSAQAQPSPVSSRVCSLNLSPLNMSPPSSHIPTRPLQPAICLTLISRFRAVSQVPHSSQSLVVSSTWCE